MADPQPLRFGIQLWSQGTDWRAFRDAVVAAEDAGWDSIWTWDHLLAIVGPWRQPIFEGWLVLAAAGEATTRIRLGLMVAANTFRHPGLTAKLATTLDHVTGGRAILGIGGAWMEREHEAFGIPFGTSPGERLDWLDEAVGIIRRLLDGEEFTHHGRFYDLVDASQLPHPVQAHLPILIGGAGPRKTLRIVARHADGWNASGTLDEMAERNRILAEHCAAAGRDPATIERTTTFLAVIRDDPRQARTTLDAQLAHNGLDELPTAHPLALGSPAHVAEVIRPYVELGFRSPILRLPSPFDRETIERLPELRAALGTA
jgi:F420-dependent oxidoreductase-like protein